MKGLFESNGKFRIKISFFNYCFIISFVLFLLCSTAAANWSGTFLSVNQAGMAVDLTDQNEYLLYIVQDGQAIPVDGGMFQVSGNQMQFVSAQNYATTIATIISVGCSFNWGEAGEFRSQNSACYNNGGMNQEDYISRLSVNSFVMNIPQLGIPDGYGGITVLNINLELAAYTPLQFVLTGAEVVYSPENVISAVYLPDTGVLYIPVVKIVDEMSGQYVDVYEVVLTLTAFDPYLVFTEYAEQQIQSQPPTQPYSPEYDPGMYNIMSDISNMYHDTSMNIINNIGGGSDYYYDYYYK